MAKNLTPEKKAQYKKAVLDAIDHALVETTVKKKLTAKKKSSLITPVKKKKVIKPDLSSEVKDSLKLLESENQKKHGSSWDDNFFKSKTLKNKQKKQTNLSKKLLIALIIILVLLSGIIAFDIYAIYRLNWNDDFSSNVASVFRLPAASINGNKILLKDYMKDLSILEFALSNNREALSEGMVSENNKEALLNRLISISLVKQELKKYNASVTSDDVNKNSDQIIQQFGDEQSAEEAVKNLYGINLQQFKEKILTPLLEKDLLRSIIAGDPAVEINIAAKQKADEVLAMAMKPNVNFGDLAKQYTHDEAGINTGGDAGFVNRGELPKDIEDALYSLPDGTVYDKILQNNLGYYILFLDKKMKDEESGKEIIKLKQIFISIDVDKYLSDLISNTNIKRYIKTK